jgi:hypothetical protein
MAKGCPKCGVISPDEARICDCGYNYVTGTLRRGSNEPDRGFKRIEGGQPYKFGWFTAVSCLTGAANPDLLEANGVALGVLTRVDSWSRGSRPPWSERGVGLFCLRLKPSFLGTAATIWSLFRTIGRTGR